MKALKELFRHQNGALVVSGGVGIGGDINMIGNINAGGALITSQNTTTALQVTGGGFMTGTLTNNQLTSNNVVSGNLAIGGGTLSEGVKCVIRNNVIDTTVNGTTLGNAVNLIELENPNRSWYFGSSGILGDEFYIGTSGGIANDPDYLFYLDTSGRLMCYPPVSGSITAPTSTDIFTARGNALISSNLLVDGNIRANIEIFTPILEVSGTGSNVLYVGGEANIGSAFIRGNANILGQANITANWEFLTHYSQRGPDLPGLFGLMGA